MDRAPVYETGDEGSTPSHPTIKIINLIFIKKYYIIYIQSKDRYSNFQDDNALGAGCCRFESYSPLRYGEIAQSVERRKYRKTCLVYRNIAQLVRACD